MEIGFFGINSGALVTGDAVIRAARLCEELGYDSVWAGEHMVVPSPRVPPSPMEPTDPILDPLVALSWAGAATTRLQLGTGVLLLPQRHPVQLAKEIASLDRLSGGRLLVGVGVAYLEPELRAMGVPMARRGPRSMEYLAAMQALWTQDAPAFDGEFVSFSGVDAHPRPTDGARGPRIVMGGHSPAAYERAVRFGDEWYGFALSPERAAECIAAIGRAADEFGIQRARGGLTISVTPNRALTPETVEAYAAAGVNRLVPLTGARTVDDALRAIEANAPGVLVR
jgi:probable F420-dependent oxidoreductase